MPHVQNKAGEYNMILYRILKNISSIAVSFCVLIFGYYIWIAIKNLFQKTPLSFSKWLDKIKSEAQDLAGKFSKPFLVFTLFATIITNTAIHQIVGIHNLKLKPEGTYCFYVEASRSGGKTYTLPAQIRIEKETEEVGDNKERTYTYYYIERLVFSNGTEIAIDVWDSAKIDEPDYHLDSDGDEWELTLLNKHAYSSQIEETDNATWLDIIFLLIETFSIIVLLYALCQKSKKEVS